MLEGDDALVAEIERLKRRNDLLDELVRKASFTNDKYETNRQELISEIKRLETALSHAEAAFGLTISKLEIENDELKSVIRSLQEKMT